MKREIKFRAWHKQQVKMLNNDWLISSGAIYNSMIQNDGIELMQYTGLKDKKGNEIYEGDIILSDNYFGCTTGGDLCPSMRKVVFDNREAKFTLSFLATTDYAKAFNPSGQYLCKPNANGSFTVVGNVYENPELIPSAVGV